MTAHPPQSKDTLRKQLRTRRAALDPGWAAAASQRIRDEIQALPEVRGASAIAAFYALPVEPDLDALVARLREQGVAMCVPAYHAQAKRYRICRVEDEAPVERRFGVREPAHPRWVEPDTPEVWLIPGVAFDRAGHRLGHGRGYYDRLLEGTAGLRIGIGFSFQVLDEIAAEAHDVGMHMVMTEQGTLRI